MKFFTKIKSNHWEEKARILSRRLYYIELLLFVFSLFTTVYLSFQLLTDTNVFKKTLVLLFGLGGVSSFHYLFQSLWSLWAEMHDRIVSSKNEKVLSQLDSVSPLTKSTIKIVFSSENEVHRNKHISYLQSKVSKLTGRSCEVIEAKSAEETLCFVTDHVVHLVLLDSHYNNEICFSLAEKIKQVDKNIPVIVCSNKEKQVNPNIDLWLDYLQRDSDIEKLLPYFLASRTINVTRIAKS